MRMCVYRSAARRPLQMQRLAQTLLCGYSGAVRLVVAAPRTNHRRTVGRRASEWHEWRSTAASSAASACLLASALQAANPARLWSQSRTVAGRGRNTRASASVIVALQTAVHRDGNLLACLLPLTLCSWHKPTSAKTKRSCGRQRSRTTKTNLAGGAAAPQPEE